MRKISKIIVHCTDWDNPNVTVEDIRRVHIKERGWKDIGYHWVILRDGSINPGRPESEIGAHCEGHNKDSIGVAVHMKHIIHEVQQLSLKRILYQKCVQYNLPASAIFPHNQFNPGKTCPNFDVTPYREYVDRRCKEIK